jgi:lipopolysaccharide export system permease protein
MGINSKLNIYLGKQLIILYLFTVGLLSAVGVAVGTLSDLAYQISNYSLPLAVAITIFLLKIPEYVAYGLPIATLLTTLIVYGRLNRECELIALRSVGISIYKIILPAIYLSVVIALITFITNEAIIPQTSDRITELQQPFLPETEFTLQRKDIFYLEYESIANEEKQIKRLYYAKSFDDKFNDLVILSWAEDYLQQIITAKSAFWSEQSRLWNLQQGSIYNLGNDILNTDRISFKSDRIQLPNTFFLIVTQESDPDVMSLAQAQKYLQLIIDSNDVKEIRLFRVRIQQKLAFPLICPIFALIGSSLGATFTNLNRGKSFAFCVGIAFSYYVLGFIIGSLGIAGLITPIVAAWLPNVIGLGLGFWLLRLANCSV